MFTHSPSTLARVSQQLSRLEKRDWELWAIVSMTGIMVSAGLLVLILPGAFTGDTIDLHIVISRALGVGLFVLLALLNTYLVTKRFEMRRLREQLISSTLQNELIEQQSFTDPLTEIYNRRSLDHIAGQFISQARRSGTALTFLMVDADNFKQIKVWAPDWRFCPGGVGGTAEIIYPRFGCSGPLRRRRIPHLTSQYHCRWRRKFGTAHYFEAG
jgi:hypothetical protein